MRAVVTGGAGFLGARVVAALRERGDDVVALDVRPAPGVTPGDVTVPGEWTRALDGADLVVHTAALVGEQGRRGTFLDVNVGGTAVVLAAARAQAVGRVVHLSSIVVHGAAFPVLPDGVPEDDPVRPTGNPYTDTKIASEHLALQAAAQGLPVTVVRPGDVYGPGSAQWTVRPVQMMRAGRFMLVDGGRGVLSPVHVEDLVAGLLLAADVPAAVGQVVHLSAAAGVTAADYFGRYAGLLGLRLRSVPSAVLRAVGPVAELAAAAGRDLPFSARTLEYISHPGHYSVAKARVLLGWSPLTSLDEGIERTARWLRDEGLLPAGS